MNKGVLKNVGMDTDTISFNTSSKVIKADDVGDSKTNYNTKKMLNRYKGSLTYLL